jgi:hypothetical protein
MAWRLREDGKRPTLDLGDGTEARRELEALVDTAGLQNIVFALARLTSDRYEALQPREPVIAACWLESSTALFRCGAKIESLWPPTGASVSRSAKVERLASGDHRSQFFTDSANFAFSAAGHPTTRRIYCQLRQALDCAFARQKFTRSGFDERSNHLE